jgi:monoamine oxidase
MDKLHFIGFFVRVKIILIWLALPAKLFSHVVIIGAGISGLTAAYELSKQNIPSTIYEALSHVGGRAVSTFDTKFKQWASEGGAFIDSDHFAIKNLLEKLDVKIVNISENKENNYFQIFENKMFRSKDNFIMFKDEIFSIDSMRKNSVISLSEMNGAEFLKKAQVSFAFYYLIQAIIRNEFGADLEQITAEIIFEAIDYDLDKNYFAIDGSLGDEAFIIKESNKNLFDALAKQSDKSTIKFCYQLVEVLKDDQGYKLKFIHKNKVKIVMAKFLIVTLPIEVLKNNIKFISMNMPNNLKNYINTSHLGRNQKLFLYFDQPVWKKLDYGNRFVVINDRYWIWENHDEKNNNKIFSLTAFLGGNAINYFDLKGKKAMKKDILTTLEIIVPQITKSFIGFKVGINWPSMPFSMGSYTGMRPGLNTHKPPCFDNICFAGEAFSPDSLHRGSMNAAVASALVAVDYLKEKNILKKQGSKT